jgi:sugar phosphate isomerase/epimerase
MKYAISNIALPAYNHQAEFEKLSALGFVGLEVAPSRTWQDTWHGLDTRMVASYRTAIEKAGLEVVGLHSLLYDHPNLGLFKDQGTRTQTLDFLYHLSAVCRDLGGRTLIWGSGRQRGLMTEEVAFHEAISFMNELTTRIDGHGTCFCFEPLGPADSDFINSVQDSIQIVETINHPALKVQLDAKALVENDEVTVNVFEGASPYLVHYHANEPGLGVLGSSEKVPHSALGTHLQSIQYEGYVSIEQRMLSETNFMPDITQSMSILKENYKSL